MAGQMSRRQLLGTLGGLGTGVLAAGFVPLAFHEAEAAETRQKREWAMVIDLRKCDGCKACTEACQATHHLPESFEWIKVFEVHDKQGASFFMPRPCFQCENAPCLKVCPVAATYKADGGVILVNQDSTVTSSLGAFVFDSVATGTYQVAVRVPIGFTLVAGQTSQRSVTVTAGATSGANFALQSTTTVP